MREFSFVDIKGHRYIRDRIPDECPICHFSVQPNEIDWALASFDSDPEAMLEVIFQCPRHECQHLFIARYWRDDGLSAIVITGAYGLRQFRLLEAVPATPVQPSFPLEIAKGFPSFVEVYGQALAAEAYKLDQVAGPGYRRALEFLIKDYCISQHPSDGEAIRLLLLSACIQKYVESPQVKIAAERAVWLGNDETHYERRWDSMNIENLKELIQLTVNWIHSSILTKKYQEDMPGS
ncbi:MAG TPA: hypothetical protein VF370_04700 [Candidatus Cryosericum sp.]